MLGVRSVGWEGIGVGCNLLDWGGREWEEEKVAIVWRSGKSDDNRAL